ncbi:hypothetical protein [Rhodocaloribacter sp.]
MTLRTSVSRFIRRSLYPAFIVALAALWSVPGAWAQGNTRVLKSWSEPVKVDGQELVYRVEIVFDYDAGEARQYVYDASGALLSQEAVTKLPRPTGEELAEAYALVLADAELGALFRENDAVLDGGFVLREDSGPCGPGTRCLQIEILAPERTRSLRFVAVDLVSRRILHRNLYPGH